MKNLILLAVFFGTGCEAASIGGPTDTSAVPPGASGAVGSCFAAQTSSVDPAQCISNGQTPIYSNRFSSACGSSSVVAGADAASGTSSSGPSASPTPPGDAPPSAMVVSCGQAVCPAGQVGLASPNPTNSAAAAGAVRCVDPPPSCADGESPQYVSSSSAWQCTGCAVVITYGATYGNYSRCASAPTIECPGGQVPTWDVTAEQWQCQPTCDNGQYDQHSVNGSTVCVPC